MRHESIRRQQGFSIVELMVGVLIGLIATIVIFQVYAVSEASNRTSASGGDAQTNGMVALYSVERDMRLAGYGINQIESPAVGGWLGCNVRWYHQDMGGVQPSFVLGPVLISQGAGTAPDTVDIIYGNGSFPYAEKLDTDMASSAAEIPVARRYGFNNGDKLILAEIGKDCSLVEVTNVVTAAANLVFHAPGSYTPVGGGSDVVATFNPAAGLGVVYTKGAGRIFNLGLAPRRVRYTVNANSQLTEQNLFTTTPATALFDGIVNLQARYVKDINGNGSVIVTDEVTPTNAVDWSRVTGVHIALVARSGLYEKEQVSPATVEMLPAVGATPAVTYNLSADERHFRFRVFQTTIPLRNMLWTPD